MGRLRRGERWAVVAFGYAAVVGLLALHRPWNGEPRAAWIWAGVGVAVLLALAGLAGHRGGAAAAAFLVAVAPWDFAFVLGLLFLALGVVLLVRRPRATA